MKKHRKCKKIIIAFVTVLFIAFVAVIGLHKTGIYRFDFLKDIYKKIDFQLSTNELNIPQDALSFSVYDIEQEEYLFYEGDSQLPTVASLAKLFAIDYALGKVDLEDIVEVNQEVLELVPAGSSLANLYAGEYTVKQIMEAMLVPSGNDAAYALAYHIAKNELGEGYTATEYIDYFMTELSEYLIEEGYSKTNLYNDPSGASMQADSHLDDINRVALKLLNYDFVKECIGKSEFSIQTPQGEFTWKSTHNRRERPVYGHRGGSRGRFYYRITTFEGRPWDARDPHKTTFMALKHVIRLSIWQRQKETPGVEKAPGVSSPQRKESGRSGRDDGSCGSGCDPAIHTRRLRVYHRPRRLRMASRISIFFAARRFEPLNSIG